MKTKKQIVRLKKELLEALFENHTHQTEVIVAIYNMVFPDWDKIKKIHGWPKISNMANEFFFDKFIAFDKKHHPNVFNGGLWLNNGFSSDENVEGWDVKVDCEIEYNEEKELEMTNEKN